MNKLKVNIGLNVWLTHCNSNAKFLNFRPLNAARCKVLSFVMIPVTKTFGQGVV